MDKSMIIIVGVWIFTVFTVPVVFEKYTDYRYIKKIEESIEAYKAMTPAEQQKWQTEWTERQLESNKSLNIFIKEYNRMMKEFSLDSPAYQPSIMSPLAKWK